MASPRALYVHVPFCSRICPYCSFAVTSTFSAEVLDRYLASIDAEWASTAAEQIRALDTIYIGGGTPALLDPARIERLVASIRCRCATSSLREFTIEANPESIDAGRVRAIADGGVTRVSIGAQSFDKRILRRLGRTHEAADTIRAVELLQDSGLTDVNVDLIYGVRDQSLAQWEADLDALLALRVTHASLYELTLEPGTPFGRGLERGRMARPDDARSADMFRLAVDHLADAGLHWYEVSNFAVAGRESMHNQVYWRNEPYWGIGPGAFSRVGAERLTNATDVSEWMGRVAASGSGVAHRDPLSPRDDFVESLLTGLRTRTGVDLDRLQVSTGIDARVIFASDIDALSRGGLARLEGSRLSLTLDGVLVLDSILERFLDIPDAPGPADPR